MIMATTENAITQTYASEDAQKILQLAIARREETGEMSRDQLFEVASELGISPVDVQAAEMEWLSNKGEFQEKNLFNVYRRSRLQQNLVKYGIVNTFLVLLNLAASHELSWSIIVLLIWGLGLALNAWNIYQPEGEEYEQAFQRWRLKKQVGQSIVTIADKLIKKFQ
jgi:hypothetical protein